MAMVITLQGRHKDQEPPRAKQMLYYIVVADLGPSND